MRKYEYLQVLEQLACSLVAHRQRVIEHAHDGEVIWTMQLAVTLGDVQSAYHKLLSTLGDNKIPPPIAAAMNAYAAYVADWAVRKGFREKCVMCGGTGVALGAAPDCGNPPCTDCNGQGMRFKNFGEQIALVHSELSEMLELYRKRGGEYAQDEHCPQFAGLAIEAADAMIRIMDMSGAYGWPLGAAIEAKMAYNENREHKHGKKF